MKKKNEKRKIHEKWLKERIQKLYGKRCLDYENACGCCEAWAIYDTIIAEEKGEL